MSTVLVACRFKSDGAFMFEGAAPKWETPVGKMFEGAGWAGVGIVGTARWMFVTSPTLTPSKPTQRRMKDSHQRSWLRPPRRRPRGHVDQHDIGGLIREVPFQIAQVGADLHNLKALAERSSGSRRGVLQIPEGSSCARTSVRTSCERTAATQMCPRAGRRGVRRVTH